MPPPPGMVEIQREELGRLFGRMVGARVLMAPVALGVIGYVVFTDPSSWRRVLLVAAGVGVPAFFVWEWLLYRRRGLHRSAVAKNLCLATIAQLAITFATGGLESPFVHAAIPIGILTAVFIRPPLQLLVPLVQVSMLWVMAWIGARGALPDFNLAAFGGGPRLGADTNHLWVDAAVLTAILVMTQAIGRVLRRTFDAILRRGLAAQQESLRAHAERAEELTALSGEIAHELKNPLASVKGLAGLLAQAAPEGKSAERLAVLRREVDRMQAILDEFLNFSRPLVPLALGDTDVAALAREVAALHEGVASERGVELARPEGGAVTVRCDPRKVKQILINLVQNALDASPRGAAVELAVAASAAGGARITVRDRGRGLDPALGEQVFSPGVTTKASGFGLGLTIARSLARQHGGDLTLGPRAGGGSEAVLSLPARPDEAGGGRAA